MVAIPFALGSYPGRNGHESAGRLINAYVEPLGPGAPAPAVIRSVPGLTNFALSEETGFRGQILVGNDLFAAFEDTLVVINSAGAVTVVGELLGTGPVYFARNNRTPTPNIVVVTEFGWFEITSTTIAEIVDADLPQPNSVSFGDGYFMLTIADSRVYASGLNDITVNALDVAQAESKADPLVRGVTFAQHLFLCGSTSIEAWRNVGNPTGFPFDRVSVIPRGLIGPRAIAGFEDGFGKALIWVGDDNAVHTLVGYEPQRFSIPDVDRDIEATPDKSLIEISVYVIGGHAFAAISAPGWTWEYDFTTETWHERRSYRKTRWRGTGNTAFAFGKWLIGDTETGNLMAIDGAARQEASAPLIYSVESAPMQVFPRAISVPRADFNFVAGTGHAPGAPTESDPRVSISWSDDGGQDWSDPLLRPLGRQAMSPRVTVMRTGRTGSQGRRWRLEVSDPVYVGLLGGDMQILDRRT